MTIDQTRGTVGTQIPQPRRPDDVETDGPAVEPSAVEAPKSPAPPARYPWVEPWGSARGARPRSEFWDHTTASWRSRGPVVPRSGD
jgi:hypothetical protein